MSMLQANLAAYAARYMQNDDPEGLASDLILTLSEYVDVESISYALGRNLGRQVEQLIELDEQDD